MTIINVEDYFEVAQNYVDNVCNSAKHSQKMRYWKNPLGDFDDERGTLWSMWYVRNSVAPMVGGTEWMVLTKFAEALESSDEEYEVEMYLNGDNVPTLRAYGKDKNNDVNYDFAVGLDYCEDDDMVRIFVSENQSAIAFTQKNISRGDFGGFYMDSAVHFDALKLLALKTLQVANGKEIGNF